MLPSSDNKFKPDKLDLPLENNNEFFLKLFRNYPHVKGYLDFQIVADLLALPLTKLKRQIYYHQPISLFGNPTASTHAHIAWSLLNNPFPVYWLKASLLDNLITREPQDEDLSVSRPVKNGVILVPHRSIKAPGRTYLHWLAFLYLHAGEFNLIKMKNQVIYHHAATETLAWITTLKTGCKYSGLIDLTDSQTLSLMQSNNSNLETYREKQFVTTTNKLLVQLLKYFSHKDAIDNNSLSQSTVLDPFWLD